MTTKKSKAVSKKRVITLRLDDETIRMLDKIVSRNKRKFKVKTDRTKMIRQLIHKNYFVMFSKKFVEQEQALKDIINFNLQGIKCYLKNAQKKKETAT